VGLGRRVGKSVGVVGVIGASVGLGRRVGTSVGRGRVGTSVGRGRRVGEFVGRGGLVGLLVMDFSSSNFIRRSQKAASSAAKTLSLPS